MLRSTYKKQNEIEKEPQKAQDDQNELPPGWTAHIAPTGHTYYYHAETKKSTYKKPIAEPEPARQPQPKHIPSYAAGEFAGRFSSNQFPAYSKPVQHHRPEPIDRPKHRYNLPASKPWILIKTKLGRRFVHNTETGESFWKFPAEVMKSVLEFDRRERERRQRRERGEPSEDEEAEQEEEENDAAEEQDQESEYEEIEVTDDEGDEQPDGPSKRLRTEDSPPAGPVEFGEDDFAHEFEDMDEFDDYDEPELSEEDCRQLFFDMLDDFKVNPYSTWEKLVDEGRVVEDQRYTALTNMKARKAAWDAWSTQKIHELKETRDKEAKKDPKIPYFELLQQHASTKLYWPEFRRKFKKEDAMKTSKLTDKDREKWYREFVKRIQLPSSTLKSDFTALLKSLPLTILNGSTKLESLPSELLADMKYISVKPAIRDPLIEAYISTLDPAPASGHVVQQDGSSKKEDRERRERALAERERKVEAEKQRQAKDLRYNKSRLQQEQMEIERAMNLDKRGLKAHLESLDD